jgi:hypothetical protein
MTNEDRSRPVLFAGENPVMRLFRPGTDKVLALASYWHAGYSEYGEGSALLLWTHPSESGLAAPLHAVYADNLEVARLVSRKFNQYFAGFAELGFGALEPELAIFAVQGDGRNGLRVTCSTGGTTVDLAWEGVLDAYQFRARRSLGDAQYDLCSVICPVGGASITVNGVRAAGDLKRDGERESSAFLALAESWAAV